MIRRRALYFLVFPLLIALACFTSGTDPGDGSDEPTDSYTHETTATVGTGGGVLAAPGFELAVPGGAFIASFEMTLESSTEESPFGECGASKVFRIDGIPFDCIAPLRLAIAYDDTLSGESYVAVGEEVYVPSTGEQSTVYHLVDAVDSSGYLVAEIPVPDVPAEKSFSPFGKADGAAARLHALAMTRFSLLGNETGFFRVCYDAQAAAKADAESLGTALNAAWGEMILMGFDPEPRGRGWPVTVTIRDIEDGAYGRFVPSAWKKSWSTFEFDESRIHEMEEIKAAAYHEFAHFVAYLYARVTRAEVLFGFESARLWLDEAIATYVELVLRYGEVTPAGVLGAPLRGLQAGASSGARLHGSGMARFVDEMQRTPPIGNASWGGVYAEIERGKDHIQALAAEFGDLEGWYPDYLKTYVFAGLTAAEEDELIRNAPDEFRIAAANDTLRSLTRSYPDLSGRVFRIPLEYDGISEGASLNFSTQGRTAGIYIFAYKPDALFPDYYQMTPLISSVDDVSVVNVADLASNYTGLLALVTNARYVSPYTGTSDITLTIHLADDPGYNRCGFRIVDFLGDFDDGSGEQLLGAYGVGAGSFVGETFVGTWSEPEYGTGDTWSTGTITVVLSAGRDSLLSVTVEEEIDNGTWKTTVTFTGENIPAHDESSYDLDYWVDDENSCDHTTGFEYVTLIDYPGGPRAVQSYRCSYRTELEFFFWNEE